MKLISTNPYTGKVLAEYDCHSTQEVSQKIEAMHQAFLQWREQPPMARMELIGKLGDIMDKRKKELATQMSTEMGKPMREALAEMDKCMGLCRYHSKAENYFLGSVPISTEAEESFVSYEPLGIVFAIMPWNFPFWQVIRFAVPALLARNAALLKHAPNVNGCALVIQDLFKEAGFPSDIFQALVIHHDEAESVIANPLVKAVTLTGSERAGKAVAALAGKYLKKTVLELGGSDPFVVFADADLEKSCAAGVQSRMQNSGQVCISAKRFIVEKSMMDVFIEKTISRFNALKMGDPLDESTDIGPMARPDLVDQIEKQVQQSVEMGAKLHCGGKRHPANPMIYEPTLLTHVHKDMPVIREETFGPVAAIMPFSSEEEAIQMANATQYGLGASVWTKDFEKGKRVASQIDAGGVFVNSMTKSDPRLPFGGTKNSGYGRELSAFGLREFVNIKTNWIE